MIAKESESGTHIEWLPSQPVSESHLQADTLTASFLLIQEDLYLIALHLSDNNLVDATEWLLKLLGGNSDSHTLHNVFPGASDREITQAFMSGSHSFHVAYYCLSSAHASAWANTAIRPNPHPNAMSGIDSDDFYGSDSDFVGASQSHAPIETCWWNTMSTSHSSTFPYDSLEADIWPLISKACLNCVAISPCVLSHMEKLGCLRTDC